jgi:hypothetical protein
LASLKKRELSEDRRRWEDNNKMYLRETGFENLDWINLAHDTDKPYENCNALRAP